MSKKHKQEPVVTGEQQLAQPEAQSTVPEAQSTVPEAQSTEPVVGTTVLEDLKELLTGLPDLQEIVEEAQSATDNVPGDTGEQQEAQPEAQSTSSEVPGSDSIVTPAPTIMFGIGQFVRFLMLKTDKDNKTILELVKKAFPAGHTTPACIAWYKTDLRKKGLLPAGTRMSGKAQFVEISEEELKKLVQ